MNQTQIPEAIKLTVNSYISYFELFFQFGISVLGFTIFIYAVAQGFIKDNRFHSIKIVKKGLLCLIISSLMMILLTTSFINYVRTYYLELVVGKPLDSCQITSDFTPTNLFIECYRQDLKLFVIIMYIVLLSIILSILYWGFNQFKGDKKNEKE